MMGNWTQGDAKTKERQEGKKARRGSRAEGANAGPSDARQPRSLAFLLLAKVPLFALVAAAAVMTLHSQSSAGAVHSLAGMPLGARVANALVSYATYVGKTFWPTNMAVFYPHPVVVAPQAIGVLVLKSVFAAAGMLIVTAGALALIRRRPFLAVGWFWYVGTLVPVIGLVQVGTQAMADRYTYVPLIGVYLMVVWGGWELGRSRPIAGRAVVAVTAVVLLVLLAITHVQVRHWRTSHTLFEHAVAVTQNNYFAHNHLGLAHEADRNLEQARVQYERSVQIAPHYAHGQNNLGVSYARMAVLDKAIRHLKHAIELQANYADAHSNLGVVYAQQGRYEAAAWRHETAISLNPSNATAHSNLGIAYAGLDRPEDAIASFRYALRLDPGHGDAHRHLGYLLVNLGRLDEARTHLQRAVLLNPVDIDAHYALAVVLAEQGERESASAHFQRVLQINPNHADAQRYLARLGSDHTSLDSHGPRSN